MQAGPHPDFQFTAVLAASKRTCASGRRNRMKLKKIGRAALALAASAVTVLGMTSCTLSYTVGYLFVTGSQYNQIATYRIQNDNGALHQSSIVGTGGTNPTQAVVTSGGNYVYVLNAGTGTDAAPAHSQIAAVFGGRLRCVDVSDLIQPRRASIPGTSPSAATFCMRWTNSLPGGPARTAPRPTATSRRSRSIPTLAA